MVQDIFLSWHCLFIQQLLLHIETFYYCLNTPKQQFPVQYVKKASSKGSRTQKGTLFWEKRVVRP